MRILIDLCGIRKIVSLQSFQATATLATLIESSGFPSVPAEERLFLDQTQVSTDSLLGDLTLLEGSVLSCSGARVTQRLADWNVSVTGGLRVADAVAVPGNRPLVIGRAPQADVVLPSESASWHHCTVELEGGGVRIRDAGSTNGTILDGHKIAASGVLLAEEGTVLAGGTALTVRPRLNEPLAPEPGSLHNLTALATAPFNRPPRPGRPHTSQQLELPEPNDAPETPKFNFFAAAAPLVMAVAMAVIMSDMRFALFALLSPVVAIVQHFGQKRRLAKNIHAESARFTQALVELESDVRQAADRETARLRELVPDPAAVLRRAALPSTLMWQRRATDADFLSLHVGVGDIPWTPEVEKPSSSRVDDRVQAILDASHLHAAPIVADLNDAGVVGIVGDRQGALALARSLVLQAAVHCGPADLTIGVFCDAGCEGDWDWAAWLPHTRRPASDEGAHWMCAGRDASTAILRGLLDEPDSLHTPAMLVVLDSEVLTEGRDAPARSLLGLGRGAAVQTSTSQDRTPKFSGLVIASTADQLPAACRTVIEVGADAEATVHELESLTKVEGATIAGVAVEMGEQCARRLARFDDPELVVPGGSLPSLVRLPELLGVSEINSRTIQELWQSTGVASPVGLGELGPLELDIVKDGPHGLVGGTTGSGKSEFLRSFVAGLAARNDPTKLNFILIDFKGGAAFKACERLPHTIGTISNLDEQLADRALRALEAEMQRRQRLFAEAGEGVDNLPAYQATDPVEPLPRLLLVIDEFAMLAKDFPDVLAALVSVAAVGRTLGVHMILATQRPAGVVNDDILANTNLRVALRVQSREDSNNVIGVPGASTIGRSQAGRAYVKLGQDDITPVQTALVTGRAQQASQEPVEVREVGTFGALTKPGGSASVETTDANDLDLLIDALIEANDLAGFAPPRRVWPEALGERVPLEGYEGSAAGPAALAVGGVVGDVVQVALVDEPDLQRQSPTGWDMTEGNLMLMGIPGSGTSTTLASLALVLAQDCSPDELDVVVLDVGSRGLSPLADLPHTTAYVGSGAGAKERQVRFLRFLRTEFQRRRGQAGQHRRMVVLVDGFATLRDEYKDGEDLALIESFYRAYADGPSVGMHFVVSTTRPKGVPSVMEDVTTQRWAYRLADVNDYASFGVRGKDLPAPVPGRCVDASTRLQMHIATPERGLAAAVREVRDRWAGAPAKADAIGMLPDRVPASELAEQLDVSGQPVLVPAGIREDTLTPALLEVYEGEHVFISGPARSGKSSLLLGICEVLGGLPGEHRPQVWGIHGPRSPLGGAQLDRVATNPNDISALVASLESQSGQVFLLVDDADRVDESKQEFTNLLASCPPGLCVIAAVRTTSTRGLPYNHWAKKVAESKCGVALQPDGSPDLESHGAKIPRTAPVAMTVGRGYLCVGGDAVLIQSMAPTGQPGGVDGS